jgi:hypothetical protein
VTRILIDFDKGKSEFVIFDDIQKYNSFIEPILSNNVSYYKNIHIIHHLLESYTSRTVYLYCENVVYHFSVNSSEVIKATTELFKILINKNPTNFFIKFPQDHEKYGIFKHDKKITRILLV